MNIVTKGLAYTKRTMRTELIGWHRPTLETAGQEPALETCLALEVVGIDFTLCLHS